MTRTNVTMTQNQKTDARILLTASLLAVVLIHAVALSTAQRAMPRIEAAIWGERVADNYPVGGINFDSQRTSNHPMNALPVNTSARDEIKRQRPFNGTLNGVTYVNGVPCDTCPNPLYPASPRPQPQPQLQPQPQPQPKPSAATPLAKPVAPKYSLSLFVLHNDPTSQQLINWFANDPKLSSLASKCNYQIYTRDNPLYKARFASLVPPEAFPAILFQDPTGGHVHASNRATSYSSAEQLREDLEAAYRLQQQIVTPLAAPTPPPMQTSSDMTGINSGPNCPDGNCPEPERAPFWKRPGGGNDGGLFPSLPTDTDPMQGFLRMIVRPGESMFQIVIILAAVVTFVYFVKRGRS